MRTGDAVSINNTSSVVYPLKNGPQYLIVLYPLQIYPANRDLRQCDGGDVFRPAI